MEPIKQIKLPDNTTYDIAAKYDIDDNEIATTYLKFDSNKNVAIPAALTVGGNITEGGQTLSNKYAARKADRNTFGGVKAWNVGTILYIETN